MRYKEIHGDLGEIAGRSRGDLGEICLVAEQVRDRALVALDLVPAAIDERVHCAELLEDRRRVDDGHEVVQARHVVQGHARPLVAEGEGLRHGEGLGDATRLDEHLGLGAGLGL